MPTPEQESAIDQQIANGRLINAIRLYRVATNASLPDAKNWVERRAASLQGTTPPPASDTSIFSVRKPAWSATGGGRTVIGLVILALVITIVFVVLRSNLIGAH
jgi:hypothetical protein